MIGKFIDFRVFLISLAIGLFFVYIYRPDPTIIYVYPTPDNVDKITYKDKANNCYKYKSIDVLCPNDKSKINQIPIQQGISSKENR